MASRTSGIMRFAAAIVLLASLTANAQHVGIENAYATPDGTYAVVATNSGAVIAWRGIDPATGTLALRTGTIDRNGKLESTATIEVPDAEGVAPSLARAGESILLAFVHRHRLLGDRVAAIPLDRHGRAAGTIRIFYDALPTAPPLLASNGTTYSLWDARHRYSLDATGAILTSRPTDRVSRILPFAGGELYFGRVSEPRHYRCGLTSCGWIPASFVLSWSFHGPSVLSGSITRPWYAPALPAAAGTQSELVLIFASGGGASVPR